tara:strand:+ start:16039 stop:16587 length:549 start_codon:yes stop_codon:yes gene_type:complete
MSLVDDMESDSSTELQKKDLENISWLSQELTKLEEEIKLEEEHLSNLKQEYRQLSEDTLPNAFSELGLSEIKLVDGTTLTVSSFYSAKITEEKREQCFAWLEANNLGDIIKNTVSANFGRGEDEAAKELMDQLEAAEHDLVQRKWVEPQTLKATVREQVEKGVDLPLEAFNVYIGQKIKVKK